MTMHFPMSDFSPEQQALWQRVNDLWALTLTKDETAIRSALHPRYVGWQINDPLPHDREAAIASVVGDSPRVTRYELHPLSVQIYDGRVGVVHYAYSATLAPGNGHTRGVSGRWTEIYVEQQGEWVLVGVSGRPKS
jgi:hypothetical protein